MIIQLNLINQKNKNSKLFSNDAATDFDSFVVYFEISLLEREAAVLFYELNL
ncbi:hypothetical protein [Enterococcus sp. BWB1-3]|uniref:hypothetical protein n=1 Tax=Enterococcus sp. BWB1-3 TaxID=2787713 RepID=UPI001F25C334|nr:hypothetical protein [Enterococcus sp. BWB1-3]